MNESDVSATAPGAAGKIVDRSLVRPTWITLFVGWVLILLPVPVTGFVGSFISGFCAFILAIVNMVRGAVTVGIVQMLCAIIVTTLLYMIAWAMFIDRMLGASG